MPDFSPAPVRAAQYLRMSKDHQRYSIRNQARGIATYAREQGLVVVKTYKDPGESGHYEFLCYAAGVPVSYCTETFENDGTPLNALLKQFKRFQAAEFSRELSQKVLFAQLLQARIGHKLGGNRRYGFDRVLVDEHDRPVQKLEPGQTKALNSQRVVWAVGASEEIAVIREIFRWYGTDRMRMVAIARGLDEGGVPTADGRRWTALRVRNILTNELLIGIYVFNRTSQPLKGRRRPNPPEAWIRTKVLEPVISRALFDRASQRMRISRRLLPKAEAIAAVARLLKAKGYLTGDLIDRCPYTPSSSTLCRLFGSIQAAYDALGYQNERWRRRPRAEPPIVKEEMLGVLRAVYEREGHISEAMLNADPSLPSAFLYRYHFGSLSNAYRLAGVPYDYTEFKRRGMARTSARRASLPPRKVTVPRWPTVDGQYSDEELLDHLRRLHDRHGYVTARLIRATESPPPALFIHRFGSLTEAYRRAGLTKSCPKAWSREARVRQAGIEALYRLPANGGLARP